ncbi:MULTISPECIES: rhomboid family intramembrane serine protease [unclassified Lentimonas]|uniref:rhomboid family intramembrane serine protease n=1 Tax=unclassified Lentimonas TaxID=2630993 RepID=UPI0013897941|nr:MULTISPECIES: rhomboid family intramembrane serine protease [unclassified Lentimonas]
MLNCPRCQSKMARATNSFGQFWHCQACDGSVVTMSLLRKFVPREALNSVWQRARRGDVPLKQSCPSCSNRMKEVAVETKAGRHCEVDVCTHCQSVWLDGGEWHDLANLKVRAHAPSADLRAAVRERVEQKRRVRNAPSPLEEHSRSELKEECVSPPVLPQSKPSRALREFAPRSQPVRRNVSAVRNRESKARPVESHRRSPNAGAEVTRRRGRQPHQHVYAESEPSRAWGQGPTEFWHWIPALFGMPVEDAQPAGHHKNHERPLLTWTLASGIFLVSALAMLDLEPLIQAYGLIPAEFGRLGGLTWLTSFFLHVGPLHLLGNLYFLVVFGDNVEKCFGGLELFLLIVVATLFGDFVHILFDPSSTIPCVGASGGISGVIAFYALRFPKTQLSMMFWFIKPFWFRMSAIWLFFLWVLMQVVISGQQIAGLSSISGGAHLGGAFVGFVAWLLWRLGGGERDCREAAYHNSL